MYLNFSNMIHFFSKSCYKILFDIRYIANEGKKEK